MAQIATIIYTLGILGLFFLSRDRKIRTTKALWIPILALLLSGSRPVSGWVPRGPRVIDLANMSVEGSPLDRIVYLTLIIAGLIALFMRQRALTRFLRANPWILMFLGYCLVSVVWSDYSEVAFKRWVKLLGDWVMILIVVTEPNRLSAIRRVLATMGFVLIPASILLIKYYPELARYYTPWEGYMLVSGVSVDKNMLGMTCLIVGLGTWWRLIGLWQSKERTGRTRQLIAYATVFLMIIWLLRMANSMTSISCLVLAGGLLFITNLSFVQRRPAVVHMLIAVFICVSFSVLFLGASASALKAIGRKPDLTGRTDIWQGVLSVRGNALVGTGFESFWVGNRARRIWALGGQLYGINESHNGYLEVFLNLGALGEALLIVLLVTGYRNVIAGFRRDPYAGSLMISFFVAAVIYAFTEAAFRMGALIWLFFLMAVTVIPNITVNPSSRVPTLNGPRPLKGTWWAEVDSKVPELL